MSVLIEGITLVVRFYPNVPDLVEGRISVSEALGERVVES